MIAHINGRMVEKTPTYVIIECSGVGYQLNISLHTFSQLGNNENCKLYTHLAIREDAHTLFGFYEMSEKQLFLKLISVSGVGNATAMLMLSAMSPDELRQAIISGDVATLKSIKGIGTKSAERIIVDLKDKLSKEGIEISDNSLLLNNTTKEEALSALVMLGFAKNTAEKAIAKLLKEDRNINVEDLIKKALKIL